MKVRAALVTLVSVLAWSSASRGQEATGRPSPEQLVLRFRAEAVDGVDELIVRGREVRIEHLRFQPIAGSKIDVELSVPETAGVRYAIRRKEGRPRVLVTQSPAAENGFELRLRIDDGPASGAAPLAFEVWTLAGAAVPRPHNVLLVTIDSLRPDRLGAYGHERDTSPNLDRFARTAVRFDTAHSTSSFTPPSHASILTGRYVGDHGLRTWNKLSEEQVTLAELLSEHGYRTGASVNLGLLSAQNLGQGFDWRHEGDRDAREIVGDALGFLSEDDGRPWFLWLHLYDVHRPYGRAPGAAARFAARARAGIGDGEDHYNLEPEDVRERRLSPEDLASIVDRYDAGIAYTDAELGPLLWSLSSPEQRSRTLVIVTADHGESLLDHPERLFTHDPFLFGAVTRVPLLVRFPEGAGAGSSRPELVSLIDLAPTVLDVLGVERPASFQGRSLLAPTGTGAPPDPRPIHHECWGWSRLAATRTPRWLLVRDVEAGATRLFSLARDPGERTPLDPRDFPEAHDLALELEKFAGRSGALGPEPAIDAATRERLRRLGYTDDER